MTFFKNFLNFLSTDATDLTLYRVQDQKHHDVMASTTWCRSDDYTLYMVLYHCPAANDIDPMYFGRRFTHHSNRRLLFVCMFCIDLMSIHLKC